MKLVSTLIFTFFALNLFSQVVKGIVVEENGTPIDLATIINIQSGEHSHTDESGRFTMSNVKIGDTLVISHMLYNDFNIQLDENSFDKIMRISVKARPFLLDQVVIRPEHTAAKLMSKIDLETNPIQNAQELLRIVPGLFIGQHAGGGKAEQIFLRGFDLDHGTDISIKVDGMPVNMVSHAHGQGYADMHFIIPETVDDVTYGKGPYDADQGNMATAGFVNLRTKFKPTSSFVSSEIGSFNTFRNVGLINLFATQNQNAYIATELLNSDGPFESSQDFTRYNVFGRYNRTTSNGGILSVSLSHLQSKWLASGQIPQRAVDQGLITRFGAIDDTEGGNTSRSNLNVQWINPLSGNQFLKTNAYATLYDFQLYSNFTFFLNDPINGDEIKQKEKRKMYGINTEWNNAVNLKSGFDIDYKVAAGLRHDNTDMSELSSTLARKLTLSRIAFGDIAETNLFSYADISFTKNKFTLNGGLRVDYFNFGYNDRLAQSNVGIQRTQASTVSPKVNLQYALNNSAQFFIKFGRGFHSNDTRVIIDQSAQHILPGVTGVDIGGIFKPVKNMAIHLAAWQLNSDQEFVYVGDAGVVEPSGSSKRYGLDVSLRYQPYPSLFMYTDLNFAVPRSVDEPEGENFIPLAPTFTNTGGVTYQPKSRFSSSLRYRHLASRPANEDNSIVAVGYTVADFTINYKVKATTIGLEISNFLNTEWNETQFATESRLKNEISSFEEIHFTPGAPRAIKAKLTHSF